MTINLEAFARYYEGQPHQKEAFKMLQEAMPDSLLQDKCAWVQKYREQPPAPKWPLTKEELGEVMLCSPASLPDSLMDDLAVCCKTFGINTRENLAYFL